MSKTALVVDDSKSARFALRKFLEGFNYSVETAESAAEAFKYLANTLPDVIFLDHIMPGVDGFEMLKQIKTDPRMQAVPVVICSSNEGEEYTAAAQARGASSVLQKPPSTEQIAGVLANLVNRVANYEATLPPLKPEDYALAATLAPVLPLAPKSGSSAMDKLMATIPAKLIPTAHLPSKAPIVETQPKPSMASPPPVPAPAMAMPAPPVVASEPAPILAVDWGAGAVAQPPSESLSLAEVEERVRQTVMDSVRSSMPSEPEPEAVEPDPVMLPLTLGELSFPSSDAADHSLSRNEILAHQTDAHISKLTQDLFAEIHSLRAEITDLQGHMVSEDKVRGIAIEAAKSRTNALAASLEQHLTALRNNLEAVLRAQNDRMQQISSSIRKIAAEEARRALAKSVHDISLRTADNLARTLAPQFTGTPPKNW